MTKEEIIKGLESVKEECGRHLDESFAWICEPIDGAIKLLEQQSSDDCVSRKSMLDAITEIDNNVNMDIYTNEVREIVNELPPVTPTQRWIPVSERLPKESDDYLVTVSIDIGAKEPVREVCKDFFCILSQQWLYYNEDVIAWQPLPKPYEEKRGEQNEIN